MKPRQLIKSAMLFMLVQYGGHVFAQVSPQKLEEADRKAKTMLSRMALNEKLTLIEGDQFDIRPIERLGIPRIHMADGPLGLREGHATAYPATVMLAATWNRQLAHDYGYALGRDSRARGVNIILGPAVNIYRSPRNSRNFEYMGEDPYLAAQISGQYITGVQSNPGVIACIKHFAANNPETGRYDVSSDVDERTLQEIYFPTFRNAVMNAGVGSVMSSYNRINGTWTSENRWLAHDVLRDTWKFPFIYMTDWGASHSTFLMVRDGVDLEMPGGSQMTPQKVKALLDQGKVTESMIDDKVLNILRTAYYFDLYEATDADKHIELDNKESALTAYNVAKEGFVLLKNEGILPISSEVKNICIIGHNALDYVSGGGSSKVEPYRALSPYEAINTECKKHKINLDYREIELSPDVVSDACFTDAKCRKHGIKATYYEDKDLTGKAYTTRTEKTVHSPWIKNPIKGLNPDNPFSARYETYVKVNQSGKYFISMSGDDGFRMTFDGRQIVDDWNEGTARIHTVELNLEAGHVYPVKMEYFQNGGGCSVDFKLNRYDANGFQRIRNELKPYDVLLVCEGLNKDLEAEGGDRPFTLNKDRESVLEVAANCGIPAIAIINAGGNLENQKWEPKMQGLIWAWYSGQEGSRALADILFGNVNPSGKLPITFERKAEDNPTFNTYSDQGGKHVQWTEGVFVGYRGYEKNGIKPLYPFGYGLSYTTFSLSGLQVSALDKDRNIKVSLNIKNTGQREGQEVVQLYVGKNEPSHVLRPAKELKQFEKVNLKAGESKTISMMLNTDDFRYYDVNTHSFVDDPGTYSIFVGTSVEDIKLQKEITL
ncbi:MAG: glycoside hydrolase family 3 C-terminal domain-containing protein [Prevotella sp.]|jgi:beta-glucosidase